MIELLDERCRLMRLTNGMYACQKNMHYPKKSHIGRFNSDCIKRMQIDTEEVTK